MPRHIVARTSDIPPGGNKVVGIDRLLFSSDYPHRDYDDARFAFKTPLTDAERKKIFNANARAAYKF
jgi:predicted TIM-barrel fold metal-dependent hydrolase